MKRRVFGRGTRVAQSLAYLLRWRKEKRIPSNLCYSIPFLIIGYTSGAEIGMIKDMDLSIAENLLLKCSRRQTATDRSRGVSTDAISNPSLFRSSFILCSLVLGGEDGEGLVVASVLATPLASHKAVSC
ncbi:hypothetical protein YC2023_020160 [Brassica napus]